MVDQTSASGRATHEPSPDGLGHSVGIPDAVKAYTVTENYENTGGIIFAAHAVVARRIGADAYGDGDFASVSCRRAPWADHCATDGRVPASLCIWHGWHFECYYCGCRIDADLRPYRTWTPDSVIGDQHGAVYCDRACEKAHANSLARQQRLKERVLNRYSARLKRRFPDIVVRGLDHAFRGSHVYVTHNGRVEQVVIDFDWPGQTYGPACFRWDKRSGKNGHGLTCCHGDKDAFEAFAAQANEARRAETQSGSVHESAVRKDAPESDPS